MLRDTIIPIAALCVAAAGAYYGGVIGLTIAAVGVWVFSRRPGRPWGLGD